MGEALEKVKRFKVLKENLSILRENIKIIEKEKKKLEEEIIRNILKGNKSVVVGDYLVLKKEREYFHPDIIKVVEKLGVEKTISLASVSASGVKKIVRDREDQEKIGRFEIKTYADVKLLK